jgi:hypothetical protein
MILFKPCHVEPILNGTKTQTRRKCNGLPRWKLGSIHQCQTQLFKNDSVFAKVRIIGVDYEYLGVITEQDAMAEGGYTIDEYKKVWEEINGKWDYYTRVWVIDFELVEAVKHGND